MIVVVAFGGIDPESQVSPASAASVLKTLRRNGFQAVPLHLNHRGLWNFAEPNIVSNADGNWKRAESIKSPADEFRRLLQRFEPDVVFPLIHGKFGEDGQMNRITGDHGAQLIGSSPLSSLVCFDKSIFKRVMQNFGIPIVEYVALTSKDQIPDSLPFDGPYVVKPACAGSSIGLSYVDKINNLGNAICISRKHGETIIVERWVDAVEIEIGIVGTKDRAIVGEPVEIAFGDTLYSFDAKYTLGKDSRTVPAKIPQRVKSRITKLAHALWSILGLAGFSRIDLFYQRTSDLLFVNEINTTPYITEDSSFSASLLYDKFSDYDDVIIEIVKSANVK